MLQITDLKVFIGTINRQIDFVEKHQINALYGEDMVLVKIRLQEALMWAENVINKFERRGIKN